jgi:hypothetical protein
MSGEKIMNATFKFIGLVSLVVLLVGCSQVFVSAQDDQKNPVTISGVWQTAVTPRICATGNPVGPIFPGILLFGQDGSLTGTSTAVTSAYGYWNREAGRGQYSFAALSLKYDMNGAFAGSRRISQNVTMGEDGNSFSSTGTFQDYDTAGNPTISGCSTSTGSRFQ